MWKNLVSGVFCLGLLALNAPVAYAQGAPEVIVRPGDMIQWTAQSGGDHSVKFGSAETTPVKDINLILQFDPPGLDANGTSPTGNQAPIIKATVKDTAPVGKTFVFMCGVHGTDMLSYTFIVAEKVANQPPRTHLIFGQSGSHWRLHIDVKP